MKKLLIVILLLNCYSAFSQTIYKKGYIVNLQNETVEGFVILQKSNDYYHQVIFTIDKKSEPKVYTAEAIKGYGFSKTLVFEAFDIPAIKKSFLIEYEPFERKFLKVFSTSESLTFYKLYDNSEKKYFIKNEANELIPMVFDKKDVDEYKIGNGIYKLPNGEVIKPIEGNMVTALDEKVYLYENSKLYQIQSTYKEELRKIANKKNCNIEEKVKNTLLKQSSLSSYTKELEKCTKEPFKSLLPKISPQVSILAIGTTHPQTRDIQIGYEYGALVELRENMVLPNFSLGVGYFENDITKNIKEYVYGDGGIEQTIGRVESNSLLLKLNYHLRNGKNLRPFVSFNSRIINYKIDYSYLDTGVFLTSRNNTDNILSGSVGVDYYLFRFLQMRAEVEYSGILSYQVGLGISIY